MLLCKYRGNSRGWWRAIQLGYSSSYVSSRPFEIVIRSFANNESSAYEIYSEFYVTTKLPTFGGFPNAFAVGLV